MDIEEMTLAQFVDAFPESTAAKEALEMEGQRIALDDHFRLLALIRTAGRAMEEKLFKASHAGKRGWNEPDKCSLDDLMGLLQKAVHDHDFVSVMNFGAMLYMRTEVMGHGKPDSEVSHHSV